MKKKAKKWENCGKKTGEVRSSQQDSPVANVNNGRRSHSQDRSTARPIVATAVSQQECLENNDRETEEK